MTIFGICYHTKSPRIFNEGTRYERRESDFLFEQCYQESRAKEIAEKYNAILANGVAKYDGVDFSNIEYFYTEISGEMY